ncbi:MAG TPA: hypothetical protein VHG72_02445 [Polyangia bacterium]|nr:hypothetical protein [Polyangia bacterium]
MFWERQFCKIAACSFQTKVAGGHAMNVEDLLDRTLEACADACDLFHARLEVRQRSALYHSAEDMNLKEHRGERRSELVACYCEEVVSDAHAMLGELAELLLAAPQGALGLDLGGDIARDAEDAIVPVAKPHERSRERPVARVES